MSAATHTAGETEGQENDPEYYPFYNKPDKHELSRWLEHHLFTRLSLIIEEKFGAPCSRGYECSEYKESLNSSLEQSAVMSCVIFVVDAIVEAKIGAARAVKKHLDACGIGY